MGNFNARLTIVMNPIGGGISLKLCVLEAKAKNENTIRTQQDFTKDEWKGMKWFRETWLPPLKAGLEAAFDENTDFEELTRFEDAEYSTII